MGATLGLCNGAGRLPQVASDEIRWRQASWPNFINWANSVLSFVREALGTSLVHNTVRVHT